MSKCFSLKEERGKHHNDIQAYKSESIWQKKKIKLTNKSLHKTSKKWSIEYYSTIAGAPEELAELVHMGTSCVANDVNYA